MEKIILISGSIRKASQTIKIAKYLHNFINEKLKIQTTFLDLKKFDFPVFDERFYNIENPSLKQIEFRNIILDATHIILICPAYNLGLPASVKNIIDFLSEEWKGKVIGFTTLSEGTFGAKYVWEDLSKIMTHLKAVPIASGIIMPSVQNYFDENEFFINKVEMEKRANSFVMELMSI